MVVPLPVAFNFGPPELILVLVVILLLFGAKRLPDLARSLGKSMSEFKKGKDEGMRALESETKDEQDKNGKPPAKS